MEFALAVHVEPYPATVMSVWVYVASMIRRDLDGAGRRSTVTGRIRGPSQISTARSRRSTKAKMKEEADEDSQDNSD